jgi:Protein of unknown function (DUF3300)
MAAGERYPTWSPADGSGETAIRGPQRASTGRISHVLKRLNQDIRWTTNLGNAFLAQQADVMAAVQRLRASAQANGRLTSTPQQTVTTETQGGQPAIVIQPANPDIVYVPTYDPAYVWGPPVWSSHSSLYYPTYGLGWGSGIDLSFWGGSGWRPDWFGGAAFVDNFFFHRHGFHHDRDHATTVNAGRMIQLIVMVSLTPTSNLAGRYQAASTTSRADQGGLGAHNPANLPNGGKNTFQGAPSDNRPNMNRPALSANPQGFHDMSPRVSPQGGGARSFPAPRSRPLLPVPHNNPSFGGGAVRGFREGGHGFGGSGFGGHGGFGGGHGGGHR